MIKDSYFSIRNRYYKYNTVEHLSKLITELFNIFDSAICNVNEASYPRHRMNNLPVFIYTIYQKAAVYIVILWY